MHKIIILSVVLFSLSATAAFSNPVLPIIPAVPHMVAVPYQAVANRTISAYRSIRAFWLTKGIVR